MSKVTIKDMRVMAIIGIYPHEKANKQELILTIEFEYNSEKAQRSDDFSDAVDYEEIALKIKDHVERSQFNLLEKLASYVLSLIMEDEKIHVACIRIDKPQALKVAQTVTLELTQHRAP